MEKSTLIYISCAITFLVLLVIILTKGKAMAQKTGGFFSDILKEDSDGVLKYSQGRFYLFLSLLFYYLVLGFMSIKAIKPDVQMKTDVFEQVISALQWIIALFAGYVFGAKGLRVLDSIFKYKGKKDESTILPVDSNNINTP